jgi:hypothetical protein
LADGSRRGARQHRAGSTILARDERPPNHFQPFLLQRMIKDIFTPLTLPTLLILDLAHDPHGLGRIVFGLVCGLIAQTPLRNKNIPPDCGASIVPTD